MRSLLVTLVVACMSVTLQARSVNGIRIDSGDKLVLVYMDGQQVSVPTSSCFIANLTPGHYLIEIYEANTHRPEIYERRGRKLYSERIYYKDQQIEEINVGGRRPSHRPSRPNFNYPSLDDRNHVMSPDVFEEFIQAIKDESFSSGKERLIENAIVNARFTSAQCFRIFETCTFDSDRIELAEVIYPAVVDKESFFIVEKTFDFKSNVEELNEFIRNYHESRR